MKLFFKVFLCTLIIITLALGAASYLLISANLQFALDTELQNASQNIYLLCSNMISNMQSSQQYGVISEGSLITAAQSTSESAPGGLDIKLYLTDPNGIKLLSETTPTDALLTPGYDSLNVLTHRVLGQHIVSVCAFSQFGRILIVYESRDISSIFAQTDELLSSYKTIYAIVLLVCAVTFFVLFYILSRPINKLTQATDRIAAGEYALELTTKSHDEIGTLTRNFINMAQTVQAKVEELELNAKQKEDFVANFAHELKTPLTSIIGYADMIYQGKQNAISTHDAAGYILNEGMRMEALSQKLMELTVLNNQSFMLIEMRTDELIEDAISTLRPLADQKQVTITSVSEQDYIAVEPDLFKTLLLNLMDNSIKAGARNIALSTSRISPGVCRISVQDDGCGIPESEIERITEAFYMVDKSRSRKQHGAGLGLALSARIAELHATRLVYESKQGEGTKVYFDMKIKESAWTAENEQ